MLQHQELALQRSFSCNTRNISAETSPARRLHSRSRSSSLIPPIPEHELSPVPFQRFTSSTKNIVKVNVKLSFFSRAIINLVKLPPSSSSSGVSNQMVITGRSSHLGRRVTGTFYGHRRGHVTFSVQDGPRTEPVFLLDLAMSTETLGKEMSSGLVRIALECEKRDRSGTKLFHEPKWTMYCNGRKYGSAVSRGGSCSELDCRVLNTVSSVTVGAGVIPTENDVSGGGTELGELLYMRGTFERAVGSRDSEAFYLMNPDQNEGPELSIFLLRL